MTDNQANGAGPRKGQLVLIEADEAAAMAELGTEFVDVTVFLPGGRREIEKHVKGGTLEQTIHIMLSRRKECVATWPAGSGGMLQRARLSKDQTGGVVRVEITVSKYYPTLEAAEMTALHTCG